MWIALTLSVRDRGRRFHLKDQVMANQQQDQNQRSGTPNQQQDQNQRSSGADHEPMPEKSAGRTMPGQPNQNPGDQGKQRLREKAEQTPGKPDTNPGMPQRGPASNPQDSGRRADDGSSGERR
jgi:hypothetical protein